MNRQNAECPVCGTLLHFTGDLMVSELVDCTDCGSELEIENTSPLVLIEAPAEEEDWGE